MQKPTRWGATIACAAVLAAGGVAISAGPALAAELRGSKSCTSTQQPSITTERGAEVTGLTTTHTWTATGQTTQVTSGTTVKYSTAYQNKSSGSWHAATGSTKLVLLSSTCVQKAT